MAHGTRHIEGNCPRAVAQSSIWAASHRILQHLLDHPPSATSAALTNQSINQILNTNVVTLTHTLPSTSIQKFLTFDGRDTHSTFRLSVSIAHSFRFRSVHNRLVPHHSAAAMVKAVRLGAHNRSQRR